jgi:2-polyprenyl-3-methyl-5-hydroxy-6-metoxy-1,4-benzoquinol methylase
MNAKTPYRLEPHEQFGFLQIKPVPSAEDIARFYSEEFYSGEYRYFNNSAREVQEADQAFHDGHRSDICATIERLRGRPVAGTTVLDIGCGWGLTLKYLKARGAQCSGFDPAPEAVDFVRSCGIECVQGGMDRMDVFGERRFDVVMLMNVLEHLADPVQVLQQIKSRLLAPGGMLVIEVPNEFNAFQLAAQEVYGLDQWWVAPPAHLNYFNPETLRRVIEGCAMQVAHQEASFPMELFLLMGQNYVGARELGRACHQSRMAFEANLRSTGHAGALSAFYQALAAAGLGRQVIVYAVPAA